MKKSFRHHPDGIIYINEWNCTVEDFLVVEPDYRLPKGYIGREYIQGEINRVYKEGEEKYLGKVWEVGDLMISKIEEYKKQIPDLNKKIILGNNKGGIHSKIQKRVVLEKN